MKKITVFIAAFLLPIFSTAQTVKEYPRSAYKPEMLVRFPGSTVACVTREALGEFTLRMVRGEKTKAKAIADEYCAMLSTTKKFKVLSVDYEDGRAMGLLEIVEEKNGSAEGAWVFTAGAEPTK